MTSSSPPSSRRSGSSRRRRHRPTSAGIIAADIVADLEAALEQFAAIEEDLRE
jgi:hypothetical protein